MQTSPGPAPFWLQSRSCDYRALCARNVAPHAPKPFGAGANNWLFVPRRLPSIAKKHHCTGAKNWATIASLLETCKLNSVDAFVYLTSTLTAITNSRKLSRGAESMPWNYSDGQTVKV